MWKIFLNIVLSPESFWHTNNSIFDVHIHYKGECVAMISFSKGNSRWWEQANKDHIWGRWTPTIEDTEERLLYKMKQKKALIDKFMEIAKKINLNDSTDNSINV